MENNYKEIALLVAGMTCASCAAHVEGALTDVPGVVSAAVNLSTGRAIITYIAGAVAQPDLERAVRETGYRVSPPDPLPTSRKTPWWQR